VASTVRYDSARVFPTSLGAGEDDYSATIDDAIASYGYVGGALRNRNSTGADESIIFWQQIGGAAGSGVGLDSDLNVSAAAHFHFVDAQVVSTAPKFLVVYTRDPSGGNVALRSALLNGQTIVATGTSINSSTPSATGSAAVVSASTAYVGYGSTLYKSTNINTGSPTWSSLGTIGPGGSGATVVRGGLAVVGSSIYALVFDGTNTLTAYTSTNDGSSWASLGVVSSSVRSNGNGPVAQLKSSTVWVVAYVSNVDFSLRLSVSTNGGSSWSERFVTATTPSSFDLLVAHSSHFCVGWTTSILGSGASLPTYSESIDRGLTWTTPTVDAASGGKPASGDYNYFLAKVTHGIGLPTGTAYSSTPLGGLDGGISLTTASYPEPDTVTGRDLLQFALVARTSAAGGPSNSEPAYICTGGWLTDEQSIDPDYFTNTSQAHVSALDAGASASKNQVVSAIDFGLTPFTQAHFSAIDQGTSPSSTDTFKYHQESGLGAIFPRRTKAQKQDYSWAWWPVVPDSVPPKAELGHAAIFRREFFDATHTQRALREPPTIAAPELGHAALLRGPFFDATHTQRAVRDSNIAPPSELGFHVFLRRKRGALDLGFFAGPVSEVEASRIQAGGAGGRVRGGESPWKHLVDEVLDEEEEALLLALFGDGF
jgi:hypothetical protein